MKKTLNLGGRLLDLSEPKIMGIVNLTPDSFHIESRALSSYKEKIDKMVEDGVDILDLGAYSTRPGASDVSVQEEIDRLLPVWEFVNKNYPNLVVSIDTFRSEIVKEASTIGSFIINDVSGGNMDEEMFSTVSKLGLPYIVMHMRGNPGNMQSEENLKYENVVLDIFSSLQQKVQTLRSMGVADIIVDPGIGFAKDVESNFTILRELAFFNNLDCPILIGLSRKSFIAKTLGVSADALLNGSTALHAVAFMNGATILRVHDVKEAVEVRSLMKMLNFNKK